MLPFRHRFCSNRQRLKSSTASSSKTPLVCKYLLPVRLTMITASRNEVAEGKVVRGSALFELFVNGIKPYRGRDGEPAGNSGCPRCPPASDVVRHSLPPRERQLIFNQSFADSFTPFSRRKIRQAVKSIALHSWLAIYLRHRISSGFHRHRLVKHRVEACIVDDIREPLHPAADDRNCRRIMEGGRTPPRPQDLSELPQ